MHSFHTGCEMIISLVKKEIPNMMIFAISLSIGFGLQKVPMAMQHLDGTMKLLMTSGLLPAAVIAVVLNLVLPKE